MSQSWSFVFNFDGNLVSFLKQKQKNCKLLDSQKESHDNMTNKSSGFDRPVTVAPSISLLSIDQSSVGLGEAML